MTHAFHTARDARYTGAATIPQTGREPIPAGALVATLTRPIPLDPMFSQLDAAPGLRGVASLRLIPITVFDFYARGHALPDLHALGRETNAAGDPPAGPEHVRAGAAVGLPAAGADLPEVQGGAARSGCGARGVARQEVR